MFVSNFRVGLWPDWGTCCYESVSQITSCVRGIQLGGNLGQAEGPTVPAGIRAGNNPFMDTAVIRGCTFAQNLVDVNHLGSLVAHGECTIADCTLFESFSAPVSGKTRFIST